MADQIKVTQNIAQVETLLPANEKVSQLLAQVETRLTPQLKVYQIVAQIEYVAGVGRGAPTQEKLLRHGTWFDTTGKKRFWWAR